MFVASRPATPFSPCSRPLASALSARAASFAARRRPPSPELFAGRLPQRCRSVDKRRFHRIVGAGSWLLQ